MENSKEKWYKETLISLLKPCPLCGEKKKIDIHAPNDKNTESIECLNCQLKIEKKSGTRIGLIEWWNTLIRKPNIK